MKKQLPRIKEHIRNNWLYKVVALFVALSIWITTIENKKEVLRSREVRLDFVVSRNLMVDPPTRWPAVIKVIGPKSQVKRYMQSTDVIALNLTALAAGPHRIEVKAAELGLPSGVRLFLLDPSVFEINIKEVK